MTSNAPQCLTIGAPLAIVILALALRVINLTGSPYGFFVDEASNGIDAYWIGHTLHDQHGAFLPAFFQALSDWRGGFYIYWEVPFVRLFGLTVFAVRLGSAVMGALTVWLTYVFVRKAFNSLPLGLIAAFLLAISPWHLMFSRIGWEEISLPFDTALCLACLFVGLERPRWLPLAFVFAALGMYTYQPGRIFFPLFCLAVLIIYAVPLWKRLRASLIGLGLAIIVLIPTILSVLDGTFFARLNQVNGTSLTVATFFSNYLAHFGWYFLFDTVKTEWITRHFIRGYGMLYPIEAPFLIIGVIIMIVRHRRIDLLLLAWLLIYPIACSFIQTPVAHRSIDGVLVFQVVVALGAYATLKGFILLVNHSAVLRPYQMALSGAATALALLICLVSAGGFMNADLNKYPLYSSGWDGWQWGALPAAQYFIDHAPQYDRQYLDVDFNATDELINFVTTPHVAICDTCMQYDPATICRCGTTDIQNAALWQTSYAPQTRQLWVITPDQLAQSSIASVPHRTVSSLIYPNGQTAFVFVATGPQVASG